MLTVAICFCLHIKPQRFNILAHIFQAYISSLTQKTSKQQKTVNFEDIGESISISSDIEDVPVQAKPAPEISSGSKFLKKKSAVGQENVEPAGNKFLKKPQPSASSPSPAVKSQPAQR